MMNSEPGRFFLSSTARCGECKKEIQTGITARLDRVAISPDADQPGDVVAMVVEEVHFPPGWTLNAADLKPRCPDHGGKTDD